MRCMLILLMITTVVGCGSNNEASTKAVDRGAAEIYQTAKSSLNNGAYQTAIEEYETLQSEYPFGSYATQGQLDLIFAYYKNNAYESAVAAADRFIRLNPRHDKVPYALYMRGIARQDRKANIVQEYASNVVDIDRAQRDPKPLERAFSDFKRLVQEHPNSEYVPDAKRRMREMRELLAEHDLAIAQFYQTRGSWVAVANRAKRILQRYPQTSAIPEALKLMRRAYAEMGLTPLRDDIEKVLRANGIDPDEVRDSAG